MPQVFIGDRAMQGMLLLDKSKNKIPGRAMPPRQMVIYEKPPSNIFNSVNRVFARFAVGKSTKKQAELRY